jgi:hypothetical protein
METEHMARRATMVKLVVEKHNPIEHDCFDASIFIFKLSSDVVPSAARARSS